MATFINGTVPCADPATLYAECVAQGLPTERWRGKGNSFRVAPGRDPGRGWFLMTYANLFGDGTSANPGLNAATDLAFTFSGEDADHLLTLSPVTLLNSECVTPGSDSDPNSVYLCEVVDRRHHLERIPFPATDNGYLSYNLSTADGSAFFSASLNGGSSQWTWQGVVNDLVTQLGLSTAQFTLPFAPTGNPENLVFNEDGPWAALCDVCDRLGCVVAAYPVKDTFAIVQLGAAKDGPLNAITDDRIWDGYPSEEVRGWRPEKVRVRFPRRPVDTWNNGNSPFYIVDVTLPTTSGVVTGTVVQLDDGFTAQGATGTPTNASTLATIATERANNWLQKRQFYERPALRVWRDFQTAWQTVLAYSVNRVVLDDTGGLMQTVATAGPDLKLEKWKPLGRWPVWWPFAASTSPPPPPPPSVCSGAEWLAALTKNDCLEVSLNGTDAGFALTSSDGTTWTSPTRETLTICGHTYLLTLTLSACGVPCLTLTGVGSGSANYTGTFGCAACNYLVFGFPTVSLCGSTPVAGGPCNNLTKIRLDWLSCTPDTTCTGFNSVTGAISSNVFTNLPVPGYIIAATPGSSAALNAGFEFMWNQNGGAAWLQMSNMSGSFSATSPAGCGPYGNIPVNIGCYTNTGSHLYIEYAPAYLYDCSGCIGSGGAQILPFYTSASPYTAAFMIPSSWVAAGIPCHSGGASAEMCIIVFNYQG